MADYLQLKRRFKSWKIEKNAQLKDKVKRIEKYRKGQKRQMGHVKRSDIYVTSQQEKGKRIGQKQILRDHY